MRAIAAFLCALAVATLAGCVSSSEYDSLQRRQKLAEMEKANAVHSKRSVERDLASAKQQIATLEQRVSELSLVGADREKNVADREADLSAAESRIATLEAQLARVREALASGQLDKKAERQRLLEELTTKPAAAPVGDEAELPITH